MRFTDEHLAKLTEELLQGEMTPEELAAFRSVT